MIALLASTSCAKSEAPAPVASPRPVATQAAVATSTPAPVAPLAAASAPAPVGSPKAPSNDLNDISDLADWEWNLSEEADTDEFEIDADATSYFMPQGNVVAFKAKALNGTPPFTYSWDFADGTPPVSGDLLKRKLDKVGKFDVHVTGKDASGATSVVTLKIDIRSPLEFAILMQYEPAEIERLRKLYPDDPAGAAWIAPTPSTTP